jgi:FAD synthetase
MRTVVVFGTFDILHPGHLAFLRAAKRHGDRLIAVVTRDGRAKTAKGRKPFFNELERLAMVSALDMVDRALLGDTGREWTVVRRLRPDVICIGYDQSGDHPSFLRQLAGMRKRPRLVRLKALRPARYGSSKIRMEVHG